jgi:hypothetical protein
LPADGKPPTTAEPRIFAGGHPRVVGREPARLCERHLVWAGSFVWFSSAPAPSHDLRRESIARQAKAGPPRSPRGQRPGKPMACGPPILPGGAIGTQVLATHAAAHRVPNRVQIPFFIRSAPATYALGNLCLASQDVKHAAA